MTTGGEISNRQKAAALLLSLDKAQATQFLKTVNKEGVRDLVKALVRFQLDGGPNGTGMQALKEFAGLLGRRRQVAPTPKAFLREVLPEAIGTERAGEYLGRLDEITREIDPFYAIRDANEEVLVAALQDERPLTIASVLMELPSAKSAAVLNLLPADLRPGVVEKMTSISRPTLGARQRVASIIGDKLATAVAAEGGARPEGGRWRTVALVLRATSPQVKQTVFKKLDEANEFAAKQLRKEMVIWEDLSAIDDRSLQQALRNVGIAPLARALTDADDQIKFKVSQNISERVKTMLYEETELMGRTGEDEVVSAREEILNILREMDAQGELFFEE